MTSSFRFSLANLLKQASVFQHIGSLRNGESIILTYNLIILYKPISQVRTQICWAIFMSLTLFFFFFNWDSLHARLNSHYEAWSYKKETQKRLQHTENQFRKNLQLKDVS